MQETHASRLCLQGLPRQQRGVVFYPDHQFLWKKKTISMFTFVQQPRLLNRQLSIFENTKGKSDFMYHTYVKVTSICRR